MARTTTRDESRARLWIAISMVAIGTGGVIAISAVAIATATGVERSDTARLVFSSVLPLLGTWVGTVLAFYFARENLDAATTSTLRLQKQLEPSDPVDKVMIPRARIVAQSVGTEADALTVKLVDLQTTMSNAGHHRIPILYGSGAVAYVIHDSTIARFAETVSLMVADLTTQSMAELIAVPELKKLVEAIGVVGPNATISDARTAMGSISECNDVFVTEQGQRNDPVLGWLTNTDLASTE